VQPLLRTNSGANQVPRELEIAIREAVGKRGVSVLVIPGDVAEARRAFIGRQPALDPDHLVFIDETWAATNMARRYGGLRAACGSDVALAKFRILLHRRLSGPVVEPANKRSNSGPGPCSGSIIRSLASSPPTDGTVFRERMVLRKGDDHAMRGRPSHGS
jgi:hypothetical protein